MSSFFTVLSTLCSVALCQRELIFHSSFGSGDASRFSFSSGVSFVQEGNCKTTYCAKIPVTDPASFIETNIGEIDTTGFTDIELEFYFLFTNWGLGTFYIGQKNDASTPYSISLGTFDHDDVNQNAQIFYRRTSLADGAENNPKLGFLFFAGTDNNPTGNVVYIDEMSVYGERMPTTTTTDEPSPFPTPSPTNIPTNVPSNMPTYLPTNIPTNVPTNIPTNAPTNFPTHQPSTDVPSAMPTNSDTSKPILSTTAPSVAHQRVIEETTEAPDSFEERNGINNASQGINGTIAIVAVVVCLLIALCIIIFFVYNKRKKTRVRKVSDNLFEYESNNKVLNITAVTQNNEGEGSDTDVITEVNDINLTQTPMGTELDTVDTNSDEYDNELMNDIDDDNRTKGAVSSVEGCDNKRHTFVVECNDEMDMIIGTDTKGNFEQNIGDNALGNDLLMDDIVRDMNHTSPTPQ